MVLQAGTELSFSAGRSDLDPSAHRVVQGTNKLGAVVRHFPGLTELLGQLPPIVIGAYPATLGRFPGAITIETWLREENVSRALLLAAAEGHTPVLIGQPLYVADALMRFARRGLGFPKRMVISLGGYFCPRSLQAAIEQMLRDSGVRHAIVHGYGTAEVDFACLVGVHRNAAGDVQYHLIADDVQIAVHDEQLFLGTADGRRSIATGDRATPGPGGWTIRSGLSRLADDVRDELESWDHALWQRRTGYLLQEGGVRSWQLREGLAECGPDELEMWDYCRHRGYCWLHKPGWGSRAMQA